jgi:hypothetical protein
VGALLARRNERRSRADDLLAQSLNDAVAAIGEIAMRGGSEARAHYSSAAGRVALHAPPKVVQAWRRFQEEGTTVSKEGRARLVVAVHAARAELGHDPISDSDARVLLFGHDERGQ